MCIFFRKWFKTKEIKTSVSSKQPEEGTSVDNENFASDMREMAFKTVKELSYNDVLEIIKEASKQGQTFCTVMRRKISSETQEKLEGNGIRVKQGWNVTWNIMLEW